MMATDGCANQDLRSSASQVSAVTGQLADATGDFACLVFVLLAASARPRVVQSATCPVRELAIRELAHPRVVQLPFQRRLLEIKWNDKISNVCQEKNATRKLEQILTDRRLRYGRDVLRMEDIQNTVASRSPEHWQHD